MARRIALRGNGQVELQEAALPEPQPDEAVIAVQACGVCGSEMQAYHATDNAARCPGHESAGIVIRPDKTGLLKEGDRVVLNVISGCGECADCKAGRESHCFCNHPEAPRRRMRPGGHSDQAVYVARSCLKLPANVTFPTAIALGGCGVGIVWHGIKRLKIERGEPVAVVGVGPIGLSAVMVLKHLGARPLAVDVSAYRLDLARTLGAEQCFNSQADGAVVAAQLKKLDVRCSVLGSGNHAAAKVAVSCLNSLGRMLVLGGLSAFPLNSYDMIGVGDKTIVGSWHYFQAEWPEILRMAAEGLPAERLPTHSFTFAQAAAAYTAFVGGNTGKVILTP